MGEDTVADVRHYPESLRRARALEPRWYLGEDMLALDRRAVFARTWQFVAHRAQLEAPGDHVVEQVAGMPVLLLRGRDGVLRAFPNVCRHRAGPLAHSSGKGLGALRCRYHGWLYDQEGRLVAAPEMQDALDFRAEDHRLPPLRVAEWQGFVFVALDESAPPFESVYAGIAERIAPVNLGAMRWTRRDAWEVACNWKVYVDNFLEGYHLPLVHPGLSKALDYRAYDTELHEWYSLQHSPLRDTSETYGDGRAWYYFVYPNVMLNVMPGRLQANRVLPLGPDRTRVEFDYFYAQDAASLARIESDKAMSDEIQIEDLAICEAVQKGIASGRYEAGRLCPRRESGVWHFHELLRAAYARDAATGARP
ncbi:MAG: aromatic ring-hydroxylating dioxygenase subunit alpha [Lysobacterales bacterium]|nr:MAG: aromatic ring-hydroxylating dioxygenase subunit alpha [Xanthomonadales bacterium]